MRIGLRKERFRYRDQGPGVPEIRRRGQRQDRGGTEDVHEERSSARECERRGAGGYAEGELDRTALECFFFLVIVRSAASVQPFLTEELHWHLIAGQARCSCCRRSLSSG